MNRREFLKKAGFAGMLAAAVSAGLTFPKKYGPLGMNKHSKLRKPQMH